MTPQLPPQGAGGLESVSHASVPGGSKGEHALVVEHLTKRFGDRVAFDDVSFEVGYGEVFGFLPGEREQGTLEPVLTSPIRREEFLVAKALAAFIPTLVIAYAVFGVFLAVPALFAHPAVDSAIYAGTHVLVQLLVTPLLAGWAIWVGIAVSARSTDVRVAQQLSVLASTPLVIVALVSLNVITVSAALALGLAAALLAIDLLAWRVVAVMFDRERLVTGRPR